MVVTVQLRQIDIQPGQCLALRETEGASTARRGFRQWVRKVLAMP